MDGLKNLITDPLGTLGSMLEEKWNLYSAVLSGEGTAEQKYQVGVDIGNLAFDLLLAGGAAFLAKGVKTLGKLDIKPKNPKVDTKRINYDYYGVEYIDDGLRTVDQPLTINVAKNIIDLVGFRRTHILNRHRAGSGIPGKTEFPLSWSDDKIINEINKIANNPNAPTGMGKWNSPYKTGVVDGIEIRVDFYPTNHPKYSGKVSTGYPTNVNPNP